LLVGEFTEVTSEGSEHQTAPGEVARIPVPGTANGRILSPQTADTWRFSAKKHERLIVEVNAHRLGSPLDSFIELLDTNRQVLQRATLRCVAKTYVTFRDHDSMGGNIRIESWNELGINDYVWLGNELLRIESLPKNPDDDCHFFTAGGQRIGFLDTTPRHASLGTPLYKVTIHPPGTKFPSNGFPVIDLPYRNDDGGPGYGKDSRLFFDPPDDGDYLVRIGDARDEGGVDYAYRLTVREPRPGYKVSLHPNSPAVWKGGAVPITVSAERIEGFEGPIEIRLADLPEGFSAPGTAIPDGENSTAFALSAALDTVLTKTRPISLRAQARINGRDILQEIPGGKVSLREGSDISTTTEQSEISIRPGQQVQMTVKIERHNGFKGRVPVDVRGLPHGVHVLDIGLNGILITEQATSRTFTIYAEPWVKPIVHPFLVVAEHEGKKTQHAAKSVLLKVTN
jgi:hypothetical protein